jgi:hypothetical protein
VGERLVKQRAAKLGIPVVPIHRAVLTRSLDHARIPAKLHPGNETAQRILAADMRSRAACFWATPCCRGCSIRATYQSPACTCRRRSPPATSTSCERHGVRGDARRRRQGVRRGFVDKRTGKQEHATARAVVLAASACESVRILLNSNRRASPTGSRIPAARWAATSWTPSGSDVRPGAAARGPAAAQRGRRRRRARVRAVVAVQAAARRAARLRARLPHRDRHRPPHARSGTVGSMADAGAYGQRFKEEARRYYGSFVYFSGRGEMIPNEDSYCDIDPW